jgi:hypothetical protein
MTFPKLFYLMFVAWATAARADTVTVTGLPNDGDSIGQYSIGGQTYWWLCIEPGATALQQSITAQTYSFQAGWDQQNTERYNIYQSDPTLYTSVIPKQIAVMEYVLDAYLPWDTLAGASGRFLEQDSDAADFGQNTPFFNALFAVQNFLAETNGKAEISDFTTVHTYYEDYSALLGTATGDVRSAIFQSILNDVVAKDAANFFDTYTAQHSYFTVSTLYPSADVNNWQDGLVIGGFTPAPEPGSALLIAACGIAWTVRRRRRLV